MVGRSPTTCWNESESHAPVDAASERVLENGMRSLERRVVGVSLSLWIAELTRNVDNIAFKFCATQNFIDTRCSERVFRNVEVIHRRRSACLIRRNVSEGVGLRRDVSSTFAITEQSVLSRIAKWLDSRGKLFVHISASQVSYNVLENDGEQDGWQSFLLGGSCCPQTLFLTRFISEISPSEHSGWIKTEGE